MTSVDIKNSALPIQLSHDQYAALSPLARAIADVCLERGSGEVVLIDDAKTSLGSTGV